MIFVTHDLDEAIYLGDRVIGLLPGVSQPLTLLPLYVGGFLGPFGGGRPGVFVGVGARSGAPAGSGKVSYFEGTPIPRSVLLTAVLAFAAWHGRLGDDLYGSVWTLGRWELHPLTLMPSRRSSLRSGIQMQVRAPVSSANPTTRSPLASPRCA